MAKEKITRSGARQLAAQRARTSGKAFNAELASINVEYDVTDYPSEISTPYEAPNYGGNDTGYTSCE